MPKSQVLTSNFTAGEFSPELEGRTDLEKFAASAKKLTNVVVLRQGGATMRPSMDFKGEVKTSANATRLIEFIYSRVDAFVLEFGALVIRVWKDGALVETSPGVPLEIVTPYAAADLALIDYTQGGDTLFLFHPTYPTRRLRRFSTTRWVLDALPYEPFPMAEMGHYADAISITLSASTVGAGRTAVPSAGFFLPADVGRTITYLGGSFTITAFTSAVLVTGTITEAFTTTALPVGAWQLNGTPNCLITPSVTGPVGSPITITANVVSGAFRAEEATTPTYIEVNGGVVFITTFSSSLSVLGKIGRASCRERVWRYV